MNLISKKEKRIIPTDSPSIIIIIYEILVSGTFKKINVL
jgi:hypothetical protein